VPIYEIDGQSPQIGQGTWVAPSAEIIGNVEIGENCYIGFGAIIRGDFGIIKIGNESLVRKHTSIPAGKIAAGSPAKVVGDVAQHHRERLAEGHNAYLTLIRSYHRGFRQV
jgi:carbonic anhydrase/acetyltransferase-like protein (isoleucine patch superfamily)